MKKLLFSALMLIAMSVLSMPLAAQVKISRQYTPFDLDVQVKRCVVSGNQGYIDLVFNNHTGKFLSRVAVMHEEHISGYDKNNATIAYDDEGTVYKYECSGGIYQITFGGGGTCDWTQADLPEDVPVKMRIELKGVSEFATEFTMLNLTFRNISSWNYGIGSLTFRNIPITRLE